MASFPLRLSWALGPPKWLTSPVGTLEKERARPHCMVTKQAWDREAIGREPLVVLQLASGTNAGSALKLLLEVPRPWQQAELVRILILLLPAV